MASPTRLTWIWASSGSWCWMDREAWHAAVHGVTKSQTWLSNWTELNILFISLFIYSLSIRKFIKKFINISFFNTCSLPFIIVARTQNVPQWLLTLCNSNRFFNKIGSHLFNVCSYFSNRCTRHCLIFLNFCIKSYWRDRLFSCLASSK